MQNVHMLTELWNKETVQVTPGGTSSMSSGIEGKATPSLSLPSLWLLVRDVDTPEKS